MTSMTTLIGVEAKRHRSETGARAHSVAPRNSARLSAASRHEHDPKKQ